MHAPPTNPSSQPSHPTHTHRSYTVAGTFHLSTLDELFRDAMPALASRVGVMKVQMAQGGRCVGVAALKTAGPHRCPRPLPTQIDVEGHEPLVFAGGQQFMQLVRPQYMLAEVLVNHLQTLHNVSALEMIQQARRTQTCACDVRPPCVAAELFLPCLPCRVRSTTAWATTCTSMASTQRCSCPAPLQTWPRATSRWAPTTIFFFQESRDVMS